MNHPDQRAPVFTVPFSSSYDLREGESVHFEARLTPTDDPRLRIEWYWNGKPMKTGSRFKTFSDFGFVVLEISEVYPEDSGNYICRALNDYGEAITQSTMRVQGKKSIISDSQLPEDTINKIAALEGQGHERDYNRYESIDNGKPPAFIANPSDLTLAESGLARFECRVTPTDDPSLTVEWFHDGKALFAGSRIETVNDFGFVVLEINDVFIRDSGVYTCKATNKYGVATTSCNLTVHAGRQDIDVGPRISANATRTIQRLEEGLFGKDEVVQDEEKHDPPVFISQIKDNLEVPEGGKVHFECRVEPKNDPSLRIDWFFNGKPFATGSRVKTVNDFGFIAMDIDSIYDRDSGEYICRATNKWGTAMTKARVECKVSQNIETKSQLPDLLTAEKIRDLEKGYQVEGVIDDEMPAEPPRFLVEMASTTVKEGGTAHFETRVEPRGDPRLKIEWYYNGKQLPCGSRYQPKFGLGFVAIDIDDVYPEDQGQYVCRAYNDHGETFTKANLFCKSELTQSKTEQYVESLRTIMKKH